MRGRSMKKRFTAILAIFVLMFSLMGNVATAEEKPQTWEVTVGSGTTDGASLDSMFPKVIYVHEGDTIKFTNKSPFAPHTVTFMANLKDAPEEELMNINPMVPSAKDGSSYDGELFLNSGVLLKDQSYSVTFTKTGVLEYLCIFHPMMTGTVVVVPKSVKIPSAQQMKETAEAEVNDLAEQADALKHANHSAQHSKNSDGTITYQIGLGAGHSGFTLNKMLPEVVYVSEDDTVEWLNNNHYEIHFVTFNKPEELQFFTETGDFNPAFMAPTGGNTFNGTGFTNSGLIEAQGKYSLKFTKAGTYEYECYLHSGDKMKGKIVVAPKGSIKVMINGEPLLYDGKQPHLHNNHVYAAIVPFAEALGGTVEWNGAQKAVIVNIGQNHTAPNTLQATLGLKVVINGKQLIYGCEPAPHAHDGKSFASLQEMVSLLGGAYSWNEATKTFTVTLKEMSHSHH